MSFTDFNEKEHIQMHAATEHALKSIQQRMDSMDAAMGVVNELNSSTKLLARSVEHIEADVRGFIQRFDRLFADMDQRLKEIEMKPARKWDKVSTQALLAAVGAAVGIIIGNLM
jgi:translation initiation factor 2B subunit (eIF-2B alpha/beta/delta family)